MSGGVNVVLVTYGEPPNAALWPYYRYALRILCRLTLRVAAIPKPLLPLIAAYRTYTRTAEWRALNYSSRLESITREQAAKLESLLRQGNIDARVHAAYEFREPSLEGLLTRLAEERSVPTVIVPMYTMDSDFTTLSVEELLGRRSEELRGLTPTIVSCNEMARRIAESVAEHVLQSIKEKGWTEETLAETGLIMSAHGTLPHPPATIRDNGLLGMIAYYLDLRRRLVPTFKTISVAWLNHVRGGRWTEPSLPRVLERMRQKGIRRLVYFPFGFLTDNGETELEGKSLYETFAEFTVLQVPCMNTHPQLIRLLADLVTESLGRIRKQGSERGSIC